MAPKYAQSPVGCVDARVHWQPLASPQDSGQELAAEESGQHLDGQQVPNGQRDSALRTLNRAEAAERDLRRALADKDKALTEKEAARREAVQLRDDTAKQRL